MERGDRDKGDREKGKDRSQVPRDDKYFLVRMNRCFRFALTVFLCDGVRVAPWHSARCETVSAKTGTPSNTARTNAPANKTTCLCPVQHDDRDGDEAPAVRKGRSIGRLEGLWRGSLWLLAHHD